MVAAFVIVTMQSVNTVSALMVMVFITKTKPLNRFVSIAVNHRINLCGINSPSRALP
jgi:hypothetical protein